MSGIVRWGILSTAWIAGLVAPSIAEAPNSRLVAVASRDPRRAEGFAKQHGAPRAYGDYLELLDDPEIDVVYIPLPNSMHGEWVRRALDAGKHVLCEKPLTLDPAEAERLFALAHGRGLILMEAFMYRHHPQTGAVLEVVSSGALGKVQSVYSTFFTQAVDPANNIRYDRALGGGALWDVGSYCVSLSMLLGGGDLRSSSATATTGAGGVDVLFSGQLAFATGTIAQFSCGIEAGLRTEVIVVGSEKTLTVANPWLPDVPADIWHGPAPEPGYALHRGVEVTSKGIAGANPYTLEVRNMSAAVRGEADPLIGRDETVSALRALAGLASAAALGVVD